MLWIAWTVAVAVARAEEKKLGRRRLNHRCMPGGCRRTRNQNRWPMIVHMNNQRMELLECVSS
jgi:hypothetical protein